MATLSEQQLVNHLLFHKAIIVEDDGPGRVDDYIRMAKEAGQGHHVGIEDPFDRSISLAFELVLDQGLDPWAIDLVKFTSLYMDRVKEGEQIDLLTAGKLLHMAWSILRMQSDKLREQATPPPDPEPDEFAWDDISDASYLVDDVDYAYTTRVLTEKQDVIDEKVRHRGDRKVTLMELVSALEEARREADARAEIVAKREAEKAQRRRSGRGRAQNAAHKEDQEEEIREVWERILGKNGAAIPLTDLRVQDRGDVLKTFVSVLFLARSKRIRLWQDDFPYGMIYVQNTLDGQAGAEDTPEDVAAEAGAPDDATAAPAPTTR